MKKYLEAMTTKTQNHPNLWDVGTLWQPHKTRKPPINNLTLHPEQHSEGKWMHFKLLRDRILRPSDLNEKQKPKHSLPTSILLWLPLGAHTFWVFPPNGLRPAAQDGFTPLRVPNGDHFLLLSCVFPESIQGPPSHSIPPQHTLLWLLV